MTDTTVTRAKVTGSKTGRRTMLQVSGLDGVKQNTVELLLPPGYTARPSAGGDLLLLEVCGSSDHVVAIGGESTGHGVADLQPGEFGLSNGGHTIVVRAGFVEIKSSAKVRIDAPLLECTGAIVANCDSAKVGLTTHTHAHGAHPDSNT